MKCLRPRSRGLRWRLLAGAAAVVAAMTTLAPIASATSPQTASGDFLLTSSVQTSSRDADDNTIVTETNSGLFFGTFTGSFTVTLTRVIHDSRFATFHGSGTFTGVVDGSAPGTADFVTQGVGSATAPQFESRLETTGGGTGGLSNLHAQLTLILTPLTVPFGVYFGTYHFD
jgi:hypothetical protein